jgi:formylglycine-generating enzyme required for sulfatase activity
MIWTTIHGTDAELGLYPVSIGEWLDAGMPPISGLAGMPRHTPVVLVDHESATECARRLDARLPTDDELRVALDEHLVLQVQPVLYEWAVDCSFRGGGWGDWPAFARVSCRYWNGPCRHIESLGFRLARTAR